MWRESEYGVDVSCGYWFCVFEAILCVSWALV